MIPIRLGVAVSDQYYEKLGGSKCWVYQKLGDSIAPLKTNTLNWKLQVRQTLKSTPLVRRVNQFVRQSFSLPR